MYIRKRNLSLILSLLFLLCSFPVYADTNGVWHDARDVRGGVFGSDEGFPSFFFNSTVFFEEEGRIEMGGNPIKNASEVDAEQIETSYMVDKENSFRYVDPSQNTHLTNLYVGGELTIGGMTSQLDMGDNTINNIKEICFEDGTCMNSPASGVPAGTLMPYAGGDTCPEGWSEYENARGRFILGSSSTYMPGDKGGEEEVRLTVEQMPSHSHEEKFINVNNKNRGNRNLGIATNSYRYGQTSETGGDEPHNNMPPYVALTWCKKDAGGSGGGSPTGNGSGITRPLDMKNTQINNVAEPTENDDAATKNYVDERTSSKSNKISSALPGLSESKWPDALVCGSDSKGRHMVYYLTYSSNDRDELRYLTFAVNKNKNLLYSISSGEYQGCTNCAAREGCMKNIEDISSSRKISFG